MPHLRKLIVPVIFVAAATLSYLGAIAAAGTMEQRARNAVSHQLSVAGLEWVKVRADGLRVILAGTAPNEAARFRALTVAGSAVDSTRLRDAMAVKPAKAIAPPKFSVELLRNGNGISIIGLVPTTRGRDLIAGKIAALSGVARVSNLLEAADYPAPPHWQTALDFGLAALPLLSDSKISITPDKVIIKALAESADQKDQVTKKLTALAPKTIAVSMTITAPRPVIAPFTLRFVIDAKGARFDTCAADSRAAAARILSAARKAGLKDQSDCTVGLGVPSPLWADAAVSGIGALSAIGQGTLTMSDNDIAIQAASGTDKNRFDSAVASLKAGLPASFSLSATLPKVVKTRSPEAPLAFTATLSDNGDVALRGRLEDKRMQDAVDSYAKAKFGVKKVTDKAIAEPGLPNGWSTRVLAGLDALSLLHQGALLVQPDKLVVSGTAASTAIKDKITRDLAAKLGAQADFSIDLRYDKSLDKTAAAPTPEECIAQVKAANAAQKITFQAGKDKLDSQSSKTLDRIAVILKTCPNAPIEIAGYTDSSGKASLNLALSQARADAVLNALMARRVLITNIKAKGYGDANPIANNATKAGREANRRIEFHLIKPASKAETAKPAKPAAAVAKASPGHGQSTPANPGGTKTAQDGGSGHSGGGQAAPASQGSGKAGSSQSGSNGGNAGSGNAGSGNSGNSNSGNSNSGGSGVSVGGVSVGLGGSGPSNAPSVDNTRPEPRP